MKFEAHYKNAIGMERNTLSFNSKCKGRFVWRKLSDDIKITDFSLSINGFVIFSFLHEPRDTYIIILNHGVYERFED